MHKIVENKLFVEIKKILSNPQANSRKKCSISSKIHENPFE
jgi:hypothetical protein